jgi:hypothetical protein
MFVMCAVRVSCFIVSDNSQYVCVRVEEVEIYLFVICV